MGLRQSMNENPMITTAATVLIMLAALGFIISRFVGHGAAAPKVPTSSYFSDDDGKTWFIDDAKNVPPFDHNGKQAYRAVLYRCPDGKAFVQRLEGFDDDAKGKIQELIKAGKPALAAEYQFTARGMRIKAPADTDWVQLKEGDSESSIKFGKVMNARCPDGMPSAKPVSVEENAQP